MAAKIWRTCMFGWEVAHVMSSDTICLTAPNTAVALPHGEKVRKRISMFVKSGARHWSPSCQLNKYLHLIFYVSVIGSVNFFMWPFPYEASHSNVHQEKTIVDPLKS